METERFSHGIFTLFLLDCLGQSSVLRQFMVGEDEEETCNNRGLPKLFLRLRTIL